MAIIKSQTIELSGERTHHWVTAKGKISHPMADEISVALGDNGYCNFPHSVELAFFKNGEWVCDLVPEFASWADGIAGDTRVYGHVPVKVFGEFMHNYGGTW